jgi:ATP-binding cassette, subfamily B, bacterial
MGMGMRGTGWHGYLKSSDEKPELTWPLMKRVLSYGRRYRVKIGAMLVLILITTGLGLLMPLIMRYLIDKIIPSGNINQLILMAVALLIIPSVNGLIRVSQRRLNAQVGEGVTYDLRLAMYAHLQKMSLRFFTHTKSGELMSRLNNDVIGAQDAISTTIVDIVTNLVQSAGVLAVMLTLEWHLTLISVIVLPFFIWASRRLGKRFRDIARQQMDASAQMNATMSENLNIGGAILVKLFGRIREEISRFDEKAAHLRQVRVEQTVIGASFIVVIGILSAVGTSLVFGIGGYLVIRHIFTIGTIVAFSAYLSSLYSALQGLTNAPVEFATSVVSFERVFEVIDLPVDIQEKPDAIELYNTLGNLAFEDVSFHYDSHPENLLSDVRRFGLMERVTAGLATNGTDQTQEVEGKRGPISTGVVSGAGSLNPSSGHLPGRNGKNGAGEHAGIRAGLSQARPQALENVSFEVAPGQLVALVGPSGAGKTTLTYLIPRLYDPTGGRILLDGTDLRDYTLASLTSQIGMVTQENHLFHDTIRANLLYARLDATQMQIEDAARAANIHEFIQGLPERYETVVGERGYRLSGGEKQRIALARVILKDPRILVLDEATSSLDSESEALIQEALKRVMAGRTSIVIAHRLSTILAADLILVLDRGQVVERGAHADLLARKGLYAHLYETQFKPGLVKQDQELGAGNLLPPE